MHSSLYSSAIAVHISSAEISLRLSPSGAMAAPARIPRPLAPSRSRRRAEASTRSCGTSSLWRNPSGGPLSRRASAGPGRCQRGPGPLRHGARGAGPLPGQADRRSKVAVAAVMVFTFRGWVSRRTIRRWSGNQVHANARLAMVSVAPATGIQWTLPASYISDCLGRLGLVNRNRVPGCAWR